MGVRAAADTELEQLYRLAEQAASMVEEATAIEDDHDLPVLVRQQADEVKVHAGRLLGGLERAIGRRHRLDRKGVPS